MSTTKRKYRVLMLVENLSVPADPRVWREARTLAEAGFQVCVICPQGTTRDRERTASIDGIFIYRYPLSSTTEHPFSYVREYAQALLQTFLSSLYVWSHHGIDIIHAANPPDMFFFVGLFYRLFGKKYIFDQHDLTPEAFQVKFQGRRRLLHRLMFWLELCSYRTAHLVITTNESQKQKALTRGGCLPSNVFVVRNGPELERYIPGEAESALKGGRPYLLLYIGVMGVQDGIEYALQAMAELVNTRKRQDISLVLLGEGERRPALQKLAQDLGLNAYVTFTGWVDHADVRRYLNSTDIGLCPDPSNVLNDHSTMLKTLEYMAMGKAIVAFDLPETRYSAQDAALYVPSADVVAFADGIECLLEDASVRISMGMSGRQRMSEKLCWERTKESLLDAYTWLLSENQP